jgi:Cupin domain
MATLDKEDGNVYRILDVLPGFDAIMHRTVSIDVGLVLEGEVELSLDSGETRIMRKGDIIVQRGTMHGWRNTSDTETARMFFVLSPIKPVVVQGQELGLAWPMDQVYSEERLKKAGMTKADLGL